MVFKSFDRSNCTLIASIGYMTVCSWPGLIRDDTFATPGPTDRIFRARLCSKWFDVPRCLRRLQRPYSEAKKNLGGGTRN